MISKWAGGLYAEWSKARKDAFRHAAGRAASAMRRQKEATKRTVQKCQREGAATEEGEEEEEAVNAEVNGFEAHQAHAAEVLRAMGGR